MCGSLIIFPLVNGAALSLNRSTKKSNKVFSIELPRGIWEPRGKFDLEALCAHFLWYSMLGRLGGIFPRKTLKSVVPKTAKSCILGVVKWINYV